MSKFGWNPESLEWNFFGLLSLRHLDIIFNMISEDEESRLFLNEYVRQRQIQLGQRLEGRKAVYLDLKFWIILRDVLLGRRKDKVEVELLDLLRDVVTSGKAFCPVSDSTFAELLKQNDAQTRKLTARLIDELSEGVTITPFEMRVGTELAHLLHSAKSPADALHPVKRLVWSKLSYVLGYVHPTGTAFSKEEELKLQIGFFDHMWTVSMSEMIDRIGNLMPSSAFDTFETLAVRLNEENSKHRSEVRSFQQAYNNEIQGAISVFVGTAAGIVAEMIGNATGHVRNVSSDGRAETERQLFNLLVAAFTKESTKDVLRTLHITACMHAYVRWNEQQRLKANDIFDFRHASAAIPYCDVFLTERSMCAMVSARHLALGTRYGCRVIADTNDAIDFIRLLR